jgi:hypothetical protein
MPTPVIKILVPWRFIFLKKFLLPLQNMVLVDLFSGSLTVWNFRGGAALPARPFPSRAERGEEQSKFELSLKYTARKDFASLKRLPRGGFAAARLAFQMVFWPKTKCIYQEGQKNFLI